MTDLTVIILCKDEALHIERAVASVRGIATRVLVVDSGSKDDTVARARDAGAEVLFHPWTTHAQQFNWALDQIKGQGGWVLRLDADEFVTPALANEIAAGLPNVEGLYLRRSMRFLGQDVRYGGVFPIRILRLFRNGSGRAEDRWMDEHIVVNGVTADLKGAIIDDNRKPLDWWISKHNAYAGREVIDMLNREQSAEATLASSGAKRWIKDNIYAHLPGGFRAGAYFFYRYVLRLGFLDGPQARSFHVLQGFWYRYLVDAKLAEVRRYMDETGDTPNEAIKAVLGIELKEEPTP
ncbi:glycosyltransferase family 2 protein [Yoonia maritima]|uniref:glycosyltransferase family 2 protein n=1 Tax=Yoonia maritima TaxID=1435347 RepID=UPI0037364841